MRRKILYGLAAAAALVVGLVAMPNQHPTGQTKAAAVVAADPAMDPSAPMPFVGQAKVQAVLASIPRPAGLGTANVPVRNYSSMGCGGIGVYYAGSNSLGYDDLLMAGRNTRAAGFFSGGPPVAAYQWAGSGWRYIATFGAGRHPFGAGTFYLDRRDC